MIATESKNLEEGVSVTLDSNARSIMIEVLASTTEPDRARIQFTGGSYSSGNSISLATGQATDAYLQGSADL